MYLLYFCLVLALSSAGCSSESGDSDPKVIHAPGAQPKSCILLYCRQSCHRQNFRGGYCDVDGLCKCKDQIVPPH
ncbi:unnamed protein product [Hermetia illucens]|uniref:Defensin n=1 Tax=Hermetia illucens TaxID=343691 RepID=A0A7R8YNE4_HERIL|nr:unnamed protein product [Hermetia illucens]